MLNEILGIGNMINGLIQGPANRAQDRKHMALDQARNVEQSQLGRSDLLMRQQQNERALQSDAYRKAMLGALGMHAQDAQLTGLGDSIPKMSFGGSLRPSALGPEGIQTAQALRQQAMLALLNPEQRPTLTPYQQIELDGVKYLTGDPRQPQTQNRGHRG